MSEETPAAAALDATLTPSEQREAVVLNEEDGTGESKTRSTEHVPFFEKEVSEAELMGEESSEDTAKEPVKEEEKKAEPAKAEPVKPPPGFVDKGALHEEREKRKQLQAELEQLRGQLSKPKEEVPAEQTKPLLKAAGVPEDFKILTDDEEDAMMEEDLFAYQKYQRNLKKYERAANEVSGKQKIESEIATRATRIVEGAVKRMEAAVPGIHDAESEINKNLTEFAVNHGFDSAYLNALTDPKTMFLPAGAKDPVYLGDGAATMVEFIHNVFKSQDVGTKRAEMEKEITEKVTAELMKKFKSPDGKKPTYKSLGDAPGSPDPGTKSSFTERDFAKMSEEEQRIALGG